MPIAIRTDQLDIAEQALREGKILVYPTETSYALGCDASNAEAVERIFLIKGRDEEKALPLIVDSVDAAEKVIVFSQKIRELAETFWPGALNIIGKRRDDADIASLAGKGDTQSVRVTSHPFASMLAKRFEKAIVATSANLSGKDALYSVENIEQLFPEGRRPDVVIDGGTLPYVPASTTVRVVDDEVEVVRQGSVKIKL